jgi:cellulose synthase/poly-beta-1,6-N-acetylglucosamine synthase-like glycosyltransferase
MGAKLLRGLMWGSLGLILWTHAGYPLAAAVAARRRRYAPRRDEAFLPHVALVIAAHDETDVLRERLGNALGLDYPHEKLDIVVALDGSNGATQAVVEDFEDAGVRLLELPRAGKLAAQNAAVAATKGEIIAFSDANSLWQADALRLLVRNLADPEVGYVCGQLRLVDGANGANREGLYWEYELWLREQESACGFVTAGNGAIYAVRRSAYIELEAWNGHDMGLPFRLRRRGLRSVYDPAAVAREPAMPTTEDEWPRKVRMLSRAWWEVLRGGLLDPRGQPPEFFAALLSHRLARYASGPLHVVLFASSAALALRERSARTLVALQLGLLALAFTGWRRPGRVPLAGAAWYYTMVSAASVAGLLRALTQDPQSTWSPSGTKQ